MMIDVYNQFAKLIKNLSRLLLSEIKYTTQTIAQSIIEAPDEFTGFELILLLRRNYTIIDCGACVRVESIPHVSI